MKRSILLISAISVFAALCSAQDDAAYIAAMKTVQPSVRALRTALPAKDNAAINAEGKKLADAFTTISAYWTAKKTDDAIKLAASAKAAATTLSTSTDADAQTAALAALNATCMGCHSAHRGGMPPNFEIK